MRAVTSHNDDAQSSSVVSIDAPAIHDLRVIETRKLKSIDKYASVTLGHLDPQWDQRKIQAIEIKELKRKSGCCVTAVCNIDAMQVCCNRRHYIARPGRTLTSVLCTALADRKAAAPVRFCSTLRAMIRPAVAAFAAIGKIPRLPYWSPGQPYVCRHQSHLATPRIADT